MSTPDDLVGLGLPDELARVLGNTPMTLAGATTAQATGTTISSSMALLTTAGGATAFTFRSTTSITRVFYLFNTSATTALIYPPSGGTIQGLSQDAAFSVAQNKAAIFWRYSTLVWVPMLSA